MRNELYDTRTLDQYPVDDDQDGKFSSLDGAADQLDSVQDPNSHSSPVTIDALHGDDPEDTEEDDDTDETDAERLDSAPVGVETAPVTGMQEDAPVPPPPDESYHWPGRDPGGVEAHGAEAAELAEE